MTLAGCAGRTGGAAIVVLSARVRERAEQEVVTWLR
ncbi:hypothetical protein FHW23_000050 [Curtobacterium pusillum]|uniref:Uncharacterized protein n=1 Tax=Curtobacterium pusillum TaxID=69373 RepID=A0AAW3T3L1_9MICO|nr:hypothetical protein [Curtobacterium pusillum]